MKWSCRHRGHCPIFILDLPGLPFFGKVSVINSQPGGTSGAPPVESIQTMEKGQALPVWMAPISNDPALQRLVTPVTVTTVVAGHFPRPCQKDSCGEGFSTDNLSQPQFAQLQSGSQTAPPWSGPNEGQKPIGQLSRATLSQMPAL